MAQSPVSRRFLFTAALGLLLAGAGAPSAAAQVNGTASADLQTTKADLDDPVPPGGTLTYVVTVSNEGPDDASTVELSDPLPAGTTFQSLAAPAGWSCTTPAVGANGTVSCSIPLLVQGSEVFTLTVAVDAGTAVGTVLTNTATATSVTPDPEPGTESASAETTVAVTPTLLAFAKGGAPDPVLTDADLTYTLTAANNGAAELEQAQVSDPLPAGTTFVSLAAPAGWSCTTPAVGASGTVSCAAAPFAPGGATFTLVVHVAPSVPGGTVLSNTAQLTVTDAGRDTVRSATATTQVRSPALLTASKSVAGDFAPGGTVVYTVVLTNSAAHAQTDGPGAELTDVLPAELALVSASATSGTAVAVPATNTVTWNGGVPAGDSVTLTLQAVVRSGVAAGTVVSNQATVAYDADGDGTNESSGPSDDPATAGAADPTLFVAESRVVTEVPVLDGWGMILLVALLGLAGALRLSRAG